MHSGKPLPALRRPLWPLALGAFAALALACGPASQPAPSQDSGAAAPSQGSAAQPKRGGVFRWYIRGDPAGGFEPHIPGGRRDARKLHGLVDEYALVITNAPGERCTSVLTPNVAEKWRYVDETTYELTLRKGVKFQNKSPVNGREMTADDVVWSYQRLFDRGDLKSLARNILSIEAPDRYTVRIKTKTLSPLLGTELVAYRGGVIIPKEAGGPQNDFSAPETLIGTGPFMLKSYTPGVKGVFERNPDYWQPDRPYVDGVELVVFRDDATRLAALRTGQVDYLDEMTNAEVAQIRQSSPNTQFVKCESSTPYALYMRNDVPPFDDVRVRQALSMSVDRAGIVKGVYKGEGNVTVFSPFMNTGGLKPQDVPPSIRRFAEYRPEEAKKLLADAGHPNGLSLTLEGTLGYGSPYNELLEVLPTMLATGGFNVQLKPIELAQHQAMHTAGVYEHLMASKAGAFDNPIEGVVESYHSSQSFATNRGHIKDPQLDRMIDQMMGTVDAGRRLEMARQIQLRIIEQAYLVMTPPFFNFNGFQPWVKGDFPVNENTFREGIGTMVKEIWLDK